MDIVHIAAELTPLAKVGGLADALQGLSRALAQRGEKIEIILPKYAAMDLTSISALKNSAEVPVPFGEKLLTTTIWKGKLENVLVTLIEAPDFFGRPAIYGYEDDTERFAFFSRSALEYLNRRETPPHLVHLHDWHTALVAPLLRTVFPQLNTLKILLTIHNLAYQGISTPQTLQKVGLDPKQHERNLLKGGMIVADHMTTVSPTYAEEILTRKGGGELHSTLVKYRDKFTGILNGIDYTYWNPASDPFLPSSYTRENLAGKAEAKRVLRKKCALVDEERPLVSAITRLVPQKSPALIKEGLLATLDQGGQFVLLASAQDGETGEEFVALKNRLRHSRHVHLELAYNEALSHLVYAASDLLIVPSLFEPCGLTQMIAMHYGTLPLVRKTGGLADTVTDGENGFTFGPATKEALHICLEKALQCWFEDPKKWQEMRDAGMSHDLSWNVPAETYLKLYQSLLK